MYFGNWSNEKWKWDDRLRNGHANNKYAKMIAHVIEILKIIQTCH
jgi:hypothetical protein